MCLTVIGRVVGVDLGVGLESLAGSVMRWTSAKFSALSLSEKFCAKTELAGVLAEVLVPALTNNTAPSPTSQYQ